MPEGNNTRTTILVACIGAAATILAVVIPKVFFQEKDKRPSPNASHVEAVPARLKPSPPIGEAHVLSGQRDLPSRRRETPSTPTTRTPDEAAPLRSNGQALERGKQYLAAGLFGDALLVFKGIKVTGSGAAKWHTCVGSIAVVAGDPATASREFETAAELGGKGMYVISKRVADDAEDIKLAAAVNDPQQLTDQHWAAYKVLVSSGIPGTAEIQAKIRTLLANRETTETKWIDRHQESMISRGTLVQGCEW